MPLGLTGTLHTVQETEVMLRGLRYGEFSQLIKNSSFKSRFMFVYEVGKIGIVDVMGIVTDEGFVKYDKEEHYDAMVDEQFEFVSLCTEIIMSLTVMTDEERDLIEAQVYFSDYIYENKSAEKNWDCRRCVESRLIYRRTCPRFSEEEIEKMRKFPKYIPEDLLEEDEEVDMSEALEAPVAEPTKRLTKKERMEKAREWEAAKKSVVYVKEEYTLKTDMYMWKTCPVYIDDFNLRLDMQAAFRGLSAESLLTEGGLANQPNRFVEMTSHIKSVQNEVQDKRMDKSRRSSEKPKEEGLKSSSRGK